MAALRLPAAASPLRGAPELPGDKSISHRALILAAMAVGESRIIGLNRGADVAATAAALTAMGARIERTGDDEVAVHGVGTGALPEPGGILDCGNSGTSARLLAGLIASCPIRALIVGDASLSARPMERVAAPLRRTGARVETAAAGTLPMLVEGACPALARTHVLEIASAQVKSALLLAALNIPGLTRIVEPAPTRDHSERLLALFGADIQVDGCEIVLRGEAELAPRRLGVPRDPSAAAFLAAAAAIVPGSSLTLRGLCSNPRRTGFYRILAAMGADLAWSNPREEAGEPVADLAIAHAPLQGIDVPPDLARDAIDEFPALFALAAFARGTTRTSGLAELRVKESDRLAAMAAGLAALGVPAVKENEDGLAITGTGGDPLPGGPAPIPCGDHRIAMALHVAGLGCAEPVTGRGMTEADTDLADTSFPGFAATLQGLMR